TAAIRPSTGHRRSAPPSGWSGSPPAGVWAADPRGPASHPLRTAAGSPAVEPEGARSRRRGIPWSFAPLQVAVLGPSQSFSLGPHGKTCFTPLGTNTAP